MWIFFSCWLTHSLFSISINIEGFLSVLFYFPSLFFEENRELKFLVELLQIIFGFLMHEFELRECLFLTTVNNKWKDAFFLLDEAKISSKKSFEWYASLFNLSFFPF